MKPRGIKLVHLAGVCVRDGLGNAGLYGEPCDRGGLRTRYVDKTDIQCLRLLKNERMLVRSSAVSKYPKIVIATPFTTLYQRYAGCWRKDTCKISADSRSLQSSPGVETASTLEAAVLSDCRGICYLPPEIPTRTDGGAVTVWPRSLSAPVRALTLLLAGAVAWRPALRLWELSFLLMFVML